MRPAASSAPPLSPAAFRSVLVLLVLVGLALRLDALRDVAAGSVDAAGDMLEYQRYAEHLLKPFPVPPPDRMPGLPLLLAGAFRVLPWDHDWVQRGVSLAFGLGLIPLIGCLGLRLHSQTTGILAGALTAANPYVVANSVRGLTEEFFLCLLLVHLLLYARALHVGADWRAAVLLGLTAGMAILVRFDSVFAFPPLFLTLAWRQVRERRDLPCLLAYAAIPVLLLVLARAYADAHGFQSIMWRTGNRFFWQENLRGRMPYRYMFYAPITMRDWLFQFHSVAGLAGMVARSTAHTVLAVAHSLGGVLALVIMVTGAVHLRRRRRDPGLPLAGLLVLVPQFAFGVFHTPEDMFRYLVRDLPLLELFFAVGCTGVAARVPWGAVRGRALLGPGFVALFVVSASLLPVSAYGSLSGPVTPVKWSAYPDVHARLVEVWEAAIDGGEMAEVQPALEEILRQRPSYAPTQFALALTKEFVGDRAAAIAQLETAVGAVPAFGEAAAWLAELYALDGRIEAADSLLDRSLVWRPDFAPLYLIRGQLAAARDDAAAAVRDYLRYGEENVLLHETTEAFVSRVALREGRNVEPGVAEQLDEIHSQRRLELTTLSLWAFRERDLAGVLVPVPRDDYLFSNLGTLYLRLGDLERSAYWFARSLEQDPRHLRSLHNLAVARARAGDIDGAVAAIDSAAAVDPTSVELQRTRLALLLGAGRRGAAEAVRDRICAEGVTPGCVEARRMLSAPGNEPSSDLLLAPPYLMLPMSQEMLTTGGEER